MTTRLPRDADATRRRLLEAAAAEFAQYGIAGARVDRIAAASQSNKAQIYHYFDSKEGLFDAVFATLVGDVTREVPMDADHLPEYAARLFDGYEARPDITRLATWQRLEHADTDPLMEPVVASNESKIAAIAASQAAGTVTTSYPPEAILGIVLHLAALWTAQTPEFARLTGHLTGAKRREIVKSAVAAITTPTPHG